MDSRSLAALLLVGQPTLRRRLHQGMFAAIEQRVALRVHLEGMDLKETSAYIGHHLALAGRSDTLFSDDAVAVIHEASRGLPRFVNNLAIQALVATFSVEKSIVDQDAARMAVVEIVGD
jgi:type II secretory pathway predicted ATPase ExeA